MASTTTTGIGGSEDNMFFGRFWEKSSVLYPNNDCKVIYLQSVVKNVYSQSMKKYNVFISYARVDDAKNSDNLNPIDDITTRLDQAGLSYWIDREGKYVGESYLDEIGKGISSSEVLIFVSSKNSLNSDWVVQELSLAREKHKKIYQICLDNFLSKKYSIQLALAGTDKVEYFDAKSREKRMSDLIEIVQNYLREIEEEQKRIEEQKRQEKEEKERQKRAEQERLKRAEQERIKKLQSEKESLTRRLTHLIGRVDCEMKEMVDLDKKLGTEFDGWNKCPICGDDRRDSSRDYCETCGWFFVTPKEYLISKERENYKERLQLSEYNWRLLQKHINDGTDTKYAEEKQNEIDNLQKELKERLDQLNLANKQIVDLQKELDKYRSDIKKEEKVQSFAKKNDCHEAVDLGLSVKWATCNVGASSPSDYGDYFAWGETEPKKDYSWGTYKWCKGSSETLTKYCIEKTNKKGSSVAIFDVIFGGSVDNKTVLTLQDDVAHVKWGGKWRMPTKEELKELCEKCTWEWKSLNGVVGHLVTGPNGNSIFLPAAGNRYGTSLGHCSSCGNYWSATLGDGRSYRACHLSFSSSNSHWGNSIRHSGHSVRPVTD